MTTTHAARNVAELTRPGGALDLGRDPARLLIHMIRMLAGEGGPVKRRDVDRALARLGIDNDVARQLLDTWTERNDVQIGNVTNAGILRDKVLWKLTDHGFDAVTKVHLRGTFTCAPGRRRSRCVSRAAGEG